MDNLLKIIHSLGKNIKDKITIRQLSKESGVPYTTTLRVIKKNKELFDIEKKANLRLISLNKKDSITKNYLILSERKEAERYLDKNPKFRIMKKSFPDKRYSLLLFGSRAERKNRKKSDIDICVISKREIKISFSEFELLFKTEINPIFLRDSEFKQMLEEKEQNLAKEIIKKHIILHGEEYFWNLVRESDI